MRIDFLNWRPDLEDTEFDGLTVADNAIHDAEGWRAAHLGSAGSFITTGSLGASVATVTSLIAKPVGAGDDQFCAWLSNNTLQVGINGVTSAAQSSAGGSITGYPLSFGTTGSSQEITVFDVCEYAGTIFFVVEASQTENVPSATTTLRHVGHMDY